MIPHPLIALILALLDVLWHPHANVCHWTFGLVQVRNGGFHTAQAFYYQCRLFRG